VEESDNIIVTPGSGRGGRMVLVSIGLIISVLGRFLVIGNRAGAAPTAPFLGFAVMVGGLILAAGRS
jgi:hypothetical protein